MLLFYQKLFPLSKILFCIPTPDVYYYQNFKILLHPLIPISFLIFHEHKMSIKLLKIKHFYRSFFCINTTHSV